MRDILEEAIKGHNTDYVEVRVEETRSTHVAYRGRELEEIGEASDLGGCVRAIYRGGQGFVSFNSLSDLRERAAEAARYARVVGGEKTVLAPVPVVNEVVPAVVKKDPRLVPLRSKKEILDRYLDTIWRTPGVSSATISYADSYKRKVFASSEGSYVEQSRLDVTVRLSVLARDGGDVQQAALSLGSNGDFGLVENLDRDVEELARKAVALLKAPRIQGREYTVILDPVLAGVFIHEAFGHLSEADHVYEQPALREIMTLGKTFGTPLLNVVDGGAIPGLRGSYEYDDEGVAATRTYLLREGVLVGRLHSRETAGKMGERPTGNGRAIGYRFPPIVRMTNTIIEPGKLSLEELLAGVKEGVYVKNWHGGMTSLEMFTFSSGEAYMLRNGRVGELIRPVVLSGNLFSTLKNIDAVGNDLDVNQGGGCGKGGQFPLPVSNGSPHIRIQKCLVSGA
ncbi:MAG: TldD/PmbA family protein [Chloroflexi bacterium]|nr:TldD/PmbA family protein [Chloroflexota bacterium]